MSSAKIKKKFEADSSSKEDLVIKEPQPLHIRKVPYIVAFSAENLDARLVKKCNKAKFDDIFSHPADPIDIKQNIINKILQRKNIMLGEKFIESSFSPIEEIHL
eukprot:CAMPEP_0170503216 /NCGR_PEP_ID=MMETSP0208-20121228/44002_1 /TAXON_ID=197538 /ORGANISM="Strombidium inclinatum, Strain S3" /LENGTH=103 /DNA_ID=CAMNT_0010782753 /DNA_START=4979 /DNA_END=5286 /DNA_ORIENTATION=-